MDVTIREMTIDDYEEVFALWQITSKRALSKADEKAKIESYLTRSEGMSKVAVIDGKIVGTNLQVMITDEDLFTMSGSAQLPKKPNRSRTCKKRY